MTIFDKKEYNKAYYQAHKEEMKALAKSYHHAHKDKINAHKKVYYQEHKCEHNAYSRAYNKSDTNLSGKTKDSVRSLSRYYLFNKTKHSKLKGYEVHHCFGYENYKQFIYIPKELHLQIHQYLRDNNINAESNHYTKIAHLINDWNGYTYIKV